MEVQLCGLEPRKKIVLVSILHLKLAGQSISNYSSVLKIYHTRIIKQGSDG